MKKQIFTLMLGVAFVVGTPVFAMLPGDDLPEDDLREIAARMTPSDQPLPLNFLDPTWANSAHPKDRQ